MDLYRIQGPIDGNNEFGWTEEKELAERSV